MTSVVERFRVVDADTHLVESPDLWTSRMSKKWGDQIPHVRFDDPSQEDSWFIGDTKLVGVGTYAHAGWAEYPPGHPRLWKDVDPATWDPAARLRRMDETGLYAQVLYPNLGLFNADVLSLLDHEMMLEYVQAYNDYQAEEWGGLAPDRLLPVTSLPFWDLDATVAEIERCAANGHKGIVFTQDPGVFGLPELTDLHWEPMWAAAEEAGLPVNFHIASGDLSSIRRLPASNGAHANYALPAVGLFVDNARTMAQIICGGICHRHPGLNFVSVESGIGWIPFALDALDWQWKNCGVRLDHPEYDLLPSEYFRRQIYGCFWFERDTVDFALEKLGADNILYETDFPHPTSMSPGPASTAVWPAEFIDDQLGKLPDEILGKILHDNAARIYQLEG